MQIDKNTILILFLIASVIMGCSSNSSDLQFDKKALSGFWTDSADFKPVLQFDGDSVYYLSSGSISYFFIKDDSLLVNINGKNRVFMIQKLTKDSLIIESEGQKVKYGRIKFRM